MADDRDYRNNDDWNRDRGDDGRGYGSGRDDSYSSARDYRSAGDIGGRDDRNFRGGGTGYGERSYRPDKNWGRESYGGGRDYYGSSHESGRSGNDWNRDRDQGRQGYDSDYGRSGYGQSSYGSQGGYGRTQGSYGSDGHRFTQADEGDRSRYGATGYGGSSFNRDRSQNRDYGRSPQGYDYQERGFFDRAGDEVRSWFGDEDAERRREMDQRYDERSGNDDRGSDGRSRSYTSGYGRDSDYGNWRRTQIDSLDRDYSEYRQENARKFENEFGSWRTNRQTQRDSLSKVEEHMEVVGSDGQHVGTVDKVRGDRIILTKNDSDAGGRHHSIPSSWLQSVDDKVTIGKTADEAKRQWRDEERSGAFFGSDDDANTGSSLGRSSSSASSTTGAKKDDGGVDLNKSFSGTY